MATIKELFKSQKKDLYGLAGTILIESRGIINAPRGAALLTSSPDAIADLIGNQLGGAFGGSANRPSDTIFKNNKVLSKPITLLAPTHALLRDSVKKGDAYFIKPSPALDSVIGKIKQGSSSPAAAIAGAAIGAVNTIGSVGRIKDLVDKIKRKTTEHEYYGPKFSHRDKKEKKGVDTVKNFSNYFPTYTEEANTITGRKEWVQSAINERKNKNGFDQINSSIINVLAKNESLKDSDLETFKKDNLVKVPYVLIQKYEDKSSNDNILLPGTISGFSESIAPEWNSFKYIGSPFNIYKYSGVERTITFGLKLYYLDTDSKITMQRNLDKLRKLVYPDQNISATTYPNSEYSPLAFTGNLVLITVAGLLEQRLAIITSMEITIDDATPWSITDTNVDGDYKNEPYPAAIDISFGMTLLETHGVKKQNDGFIFDYNFTKPSIVKKETKA